MKKYKTIVVDPPWPIKPIKMKRRPNSQTLPYKTMSLGEIYELPVSDISQNQAGLFLWTTHTYLPQAIELLKKWGFKYHCIITWDKGNGYSVSGFTRRTEFVVYGYKNKNVVNQRGKYIPTLITEKRGQHSEKPKLLYDWLQSNSPEPRIDLFARKERQGWDVWGNEVNSDIDLSNRET